MGAWTRGTVGPADTKNRWAYHAYCAIRTRLQPGRWSRW